MTSIKLVDQIAATAQTMGNVFSAVGYLTPTSGSQAVLTPAGQPLMLPQNAFIICGSVVPMLPLVGGTSVQIGASATQAGAVSTVFGPVVTPAMPTGTGLGTTAIAVPSGSQFVSGTSIGTFTSGRVQVVLKFLLPFTV